MFCLSCYIHYLYPSNLSQYLDLTTSGHNPSSLDTKNDIDSKNLNVLVSDNN